MEGQSLRLARALTGWLSRAQGMREADVVETLDPEVAAFRAQDVTEGQEMVSRGVEAFENLDLDIAGAELDMAVNLLLSHAASLTPAERTALDNGLFTLATTNLFEGAGDLADQVFIALALFSPTFRPAQDSFPSNVVARFGKLKRSIDQRATGAIEVRSNPLGAAVYVDGVFRGSTPLTVDGVVDGQHAVVVEKLGYRPFGTLSPVSAARTSRVDLDLEPTKAVPFLETINAAVVDDPRAAIAIGETLELDRLAIVLLSVRLAQPRVRGLWLDIGAKSVLAQIPETALVSDPDVAASAVIGAIAGAVEDRELAEAEAAASPPFEWPGWMGEWWFWAAVGGVAVVAATTAGAVAATSGDEPPPSGFGVFGF